MATNQSIAVFTRVSTCSMAIGTMLALLLSACGGDSSSSGPSGNGTSDSDIMADTFDDLPVCSDKREGVIAYVKDKKIAYVCEGVLMATKTKNPLLLVIARTVRTRPFQVAAQTK